MVQPDRAEQADSLLEQFLADRDVPCPVCRYNLRGLDSKKCPECGMRLEVRIGASDFRLGAWLIALLSVALPCGFFLILLTILAALSLHYGEWPPAEAMLPLAGAALVYGLCVCGILAARRRFWRQRGAMQRIVPLGTALLSVLVATAIVRWLWYAIQQW